MLSTFVYYAFMFLNSGSICIIFDIRRCRQAAPCLLKGHLMIERVDGLDTKR